MPRGLPSGDTREGFARHLEWERALFDARWAVVSWPEEYGGREASPMEWLIFEEEYYRAGGPQRVTQNGIFLLAPTVFAFGTREQQDQHPPAHGRGRGPVVPGLVGARCGQRSRRHHVARGPRRSGRRLAAVGAEDVDDPRCVLHPPVRPLPVGSGRGAPSGAHLLPRAARRAGRDACGASAGSTATRASPRCSSTTCSCPTPASSVRSHQGWRVAMATTSAERGLTLRSPGRFLAGAARLVDLWRERGAEADARIATTWCERGSTPRPTAGRRSSR